MKNEHTLSASLAKIAHTFQSSYLLKRIPFKAHTLTFQPKHLTGPAPAQYAACAIMPTTLPFRPLTQCTSPPLMCIKRLTNPCSTHAIKPNHLEQAWTPAQGQEHNDHTTTTSNKCCMQSDARLPQQLLNAHHVPSSRSTCFKILLPLLTVWPGSSAICTVNHAASRRRRMLQCCSGRRQNRKQAVSPCQTKTALWP